MSSLVDLLTGCTRDVGDLLLLPQLYKISESLSIALRLKCFEVIGRERWTVERLAERLECDAARLKPVLDLLTILGLLRFEEGVIANTALARHYLTDERRSNLTPLLLYAGNGEFSAARVIAQLLGEAANSERVLQSDGLRVYMDAMAVGSRLVALHVARHLPMTQDAQLLDLGCGPGTLSIAACRHNDGLHAECVDRAEVIEIVRREVEASGLRDRIELRCDDILTVQLQKEHYDFVLLSNVLHLFSTTEVTAILESSIAALQPTGFLIVVDAFSRGGTLGSSLMSLEWLSWGGTFSSLAELQRTLRGMGIAEITVDEIDKTPYQVVWAAKHAE